MHQLRHRDTATVETCPSRTGSMANGKETTAGPSVRLYTSEYVTPEKLQ